MFTFEVRLCSLCSCSLSLAVTLASPGLARAEASPPPVAGRLIEAAPAQPIDHPPEQQTLEPIEWRVEMRRNRHGHYYRVEQAFQYGQLLEGVRLYRVIGREDLASAFERRADSSRLVAAVAGAAMVASLGVGLLTTPRPECRPLWSTCRAVNDLSLGVFAAAPFVIFGALVFDPDPLSVEERHDLVDEYNASLRQGELRPPALLHPRDFALMPTISADGAGVVLGASF